MTRYRLNAHVVSNLVDTDFRHYVVYYLLFNTTILVLIVVFCNTHLLICTICKGRCFFHLQGRRIGPTVCYFVSVQTVNNMHTYAILRPYGQKINGNATIYTLQQVAKTGIVG